MLNHRRSAQECGSVRQKSSVPAAAIGKGCPLRSSFLSRPGAKVGGGVVNRLPAGKKRSNALTEGLCAVLCVGGRRLLPCYKNSGPFVHRNAAGNISGGWGGRVSNLRHLGAGKCSK